MINLEVSETYENFKHNSFKNFLSSYNSNKNLKVSEIWKNDQDQIVLIEVNQFLQRSFMRNNLDFRMNDFSNNNYSNLKYVYNLKMLFKREFIDISQFLKFMSGTKINYLKQYFLSRKLKYHDLKKESESINDQRKPVKNYKIIRDELKEILNQKQVYLDSNQVDIQKRKRIYKKLNNSNTSKLRNYESLTKFNLLYIWTIWLKFKSQIILQNTFPYTSLNSLQQIIQRIKKGYLNPQKRIQLKLSNVSAHNINLIWNQFQDHLTGQNTIETIRIKIQRDLKISLSIQQIRRILVQYKITRKKVKFIDFKGMTLLGLCKYIQNILQFYRFEQKFDHQSSNDESQLKRNEISKYGQSKSGTGLSKGHHAHPHKTSFIASISDQGVDCFQQLQGDQNNHSQYVQIKENLMQLDSRQGNRNYYTCSDGVAFHRNPVVINLQEHLKVQTMILSPDCSPINKIELFNNVFKREQRQIGSIENITHNERIAKALKRVNLTKIQGIHSEWYSSIIEKLKEYERRILIQNK